MNSSSGTSDLSQNGIKQIRTLYPHSDSKVTNVNFIFEVTMAKVYTSEELMERSN